MKVLSRMALLIFIVAVAGCAGDGGVKPDAGATVLGAGDGGALTGDRLTDDSGRPLIMRVHFDFDSSSIDADNRETLEAHAAYLTANEDLNIKLEGHADERGTREYNLALGERRAKAVARMLAVLGVARSRMETTSYGEEKPLDEGSGETAWKRNRRVEIIY
ncbi:MAG: peptidoglycan-associated lipoprotein Pal [Acidiferrobacterales bacterium]